jgi:hypothetical protein
MIAQPFPITTNKYLALLQRLPDYFRDANGKPNGHHVVNVLKKSKFTSLDDKNIDDAEAVLLKYADEKTKRVLGVTVMAIDQPMTDAQYETYQSLRGYTAASLRGLALLFNQLRKNAAAMKALSLDMHTDVRRWARAVEYFRPYFIDEQSYLHTTDEYELLFRYARLKRASATALFAERKFSLTPQLLDELIDKVLETEREGHKRRITDKMRMDKLNELTGHDMRDVLTQLIESGI